MKTLIRDFLKNRLSAAGVSYVVTSRSKWRRHVWSIILLVTAGIMVFMTFKVTKEYLQYPKTVVKEEYIPSSLPFPAVTVCDLNPISSDNLHKTSMAKLNKLMKLLNESEFASISKEIRKKCYGHPMCHWSTFTEYCVCASSPCYSGICARETKKDCICPKQMCTHPDENLTGACHNGANKDAGRCLCNDDFKFQGSDDGRQAAAADLGVLLKSQGDSDLRDLIALITKSEAPDLRTVEEDLMPNFQDLYDYGRLFSGFVLSCSFEGHKCDLQNFTLFLHPKYGRCYIFNYSGVKNELQDEAVQTHSYGSTTGLYLMLRTKVSDVVPLLTREMGVRISVHSSKELPYISENGFDIPVGHVTAAEVELSKVMGLEAPWGNCLEDGSALNFEYEERPYNQLGCQKFCQHHHTQKLCNCTKRSFFKGSVVYDDIYHKLTFCRATNETQINCLNRVVKDIEMNKIQCNCFPSCKEDVYKVSLSSSIVNKEFFDTVKGVMTLKFEDNKTKRSEPLSGDGILGLKIYYRTLQVDTIKEVPAYRLETLVANIGGNMGFFMGLSVVTFVEVFEFLWDILLSILNCNRRNAQEETPKARNINVVHPFDQDHSTTARQLHFQNHKSLTQAVGATEHCDNMESLSTGKDESDTMTLFRKRIPNRQHGLRYPFVRRSKFMKRLRTSKKKQDSTCTPTLYSE